MVWTSPALDVMALLACLHLFKTFVLFDKTGNEVESKIPGGQK